MDQARRTRVVLPDDRRLEIAIKPKLLSVELFNIVASHCSLKEPDQRYFGLAFYDDGGHCHWLEDGRRVLDHNIPLRSPVLYLLPKFYPDCVTRMCQAWSVQLLFFSVQRLIAEGSMDCDDRTLCQLAAYHMQAFFGDFVQVSVARSNLRSMAMFPARLKDKEECQDWTLECYEKERGKSKGRAVLDYISLAEQLHSYGVQSFPVLDNGGERITLGVSSRGIYQYQGEDRTTPKRVFYWKQLENMYYRDRRFSLEVNDLGRVVHALSSFNVYQDAVMESGDELTEAIGHPSTTVSVSRRALVPSGSNVRVFWCENAQLCKTLWSMAVAQHAFYLEKKTRETRSPVADGEHKREELAQQLDLLMQQGLNRASSPSPSHSGGWEEDRAELQRRLRCRKGQLKLVLADKMKQLKEVCIREGELTGEVPAEIKLALAPGETPPKIKRRVGTAFVIDWDTVSKHRKADQIARLEADVDVRKKIVAAATKLASDSAANKSVRRKRRRDCEAARQRLRETEQRLLQLRISGSKPDLTGALSPSVSADCWPVSKSLPATPRGSTVDLTKTSEGTSAKRLPLPPPPPPPPLDRMRAKPPPVPRANRVEKNGRPVGSYNWPSQWTSRPRVPSEICTGSLDRRLARCLETVKPYETSDLIKYGSNADAWWISNIRANTGSQGPHWSDAKTPTIV